MRQPGKEGADEHTDDACGRSGCGLPRHCGLPSRPGARPPLGRAAWGGIHARLPVKLRIASAFAVGVWVLAALIILGRAGSLVSPLPPAFPRWGTWILFGVNLLAALMNFASHSSWERFFWAPVALILAVLCLVVVLSGSPVPQADRASASINGATARATRATTAGDRCGACPRLMQRNTSGEEVLSPDKSRSPSRWVTERGPQPLRSQRLAGAN